MRSQRSIKSILERQKLKVGVLESRRRVARYRHLRLAQRSLHLCPCHRGAAGHQDWLHRRGGLSIQALLTVSSCLALASDQLEKSGYGAYLKRVAHL